MAKLVAIQSLGGSLYLVTEVDPAGIDNTLPGGGGRLDNTLPGGTGGRPSQGLPGMPDNSLPGGSGGRPGNTLPANPHFPNNELPAYAPPEIMPGNTLVMIRHQGKWAYATIPAGGGTPKPIEPPPSTIDNTLPTTPPPTAGQPLPPAPAPKT